MNWRDVLSQYDLPEHPDVSPMGGTAGPKVMVATPTNRYVLRCRPADMAQRGWVEHDHALRTFLSDRKFPAPPPVAARNGRTWVEADGHLFEMAPLLPGQMMGDPSPLQIHQAGKAIATLHKLTADFQHPGKNDFVREDHITILQPLMDRIVPLAETAEQRQQLADLQRELNELAGHLDDATCRALDSAVIHGDFHPGNVLYDGDGIGAVLDYDYAAPGPVLRDIGDGLAFFAAKRAHPFDPDDIWSLTQPWQVNDERAAAFLTGYAAVAPIPPSWPWVCTLMLSRWFQVKLRGARKVPDHQKVPFVLRGLWPPVALLKRHYQAWLAVLLRHL